METMDKKDIIHKIPIFSDFDSVEVEEFDKISKIKTFSPGEFIFREGEGGENFYVILEGNVDIRKRLEGDEDVTLAILGKNDFFGEIEAIKPAPQGRAASAVAETEVKVLEIPRSGILFCLTDGRGCGWKLLYFFTQVLCERLRKMDEEYIKLFMESKGKEKIGELRSFGEKILKEWGF